MKNTYYFLLICCLILSMQTAHASNGFSGCTAPCNVNANQRSFTRTYQSVTYSSHTKRKTPIARRAEDVVITYDDFLDHLKVENERKVMRLDNSSISMDIGGFDSTGENPQTWVMPDLHELGATAFTGNHIGLETTAFSDSFPDPTHVLHAIESDRNEFYQLTQDDLFYYGYEESELVSGGPFAVDVYTALTPVPLNWGLEYTGIVAFIAPEEETEYDSIHYVQLYDVIAQGTLVTFDDGEVPAVKLIFTEEAYSYKDGVETFEGLFDELIWYSKEGHYIRAGIDDAYADTGLVDLTYMTYQKITDEVTGITNTIKNKSMDFFPNPVEAGDILHFNADYSLLSNSITFFNMQGVEVTQLAFASANEVLVPNTLENGVYFYQINSNNGSETFSGKIQVE